VANEQLRSGLARAEVDVDELAAQLEVDAKTVQRWLGGRVPHPRHRARIAAALQLDEHDLWPDAAPAAGPADDRQDLAGIYTHAGDVRAPDWRVLLSTARQQVDLLDTTLSALLTVPGTVDLLAEKASSGVAIRLLVAHPKSIWLTSVAEQLGHTDTDDNGDTALDREIDHALELLAPLAGRDGIRVRTCWAERTVSVLRFDDQMLVVQHLYATRATEAPLLYLRRHSDEGLFDRYLGHVERIVDHASEPMPDRLVPR
jgi:hypothetical protein